MLVPRLARGAWRESQTAASVIPESSVSPDGQHLPPRLDSGTVLVRTSKAGKVRHIELTAEGLEFFNETTAGRAGSELLFHRNNTAWGKSHQQRPLTEACRAARITLAASFHTLRHTYASLMVMDSVPLMVVARNLGHADTRMVEKHYGHLATSYVREAIRAASPLGIVDAVEVVPIAGAR